jgi:hypothetical protein
MRPDVRLVENVTHPGELLGQRFAQAVAAIADANDLRPARQPSTDRGAEQLVGDFGIGAQVRYRGPFNLFGPARQPHAHITPLLLPASAFLLAHRCAFPT